MAPSIVTEYLTDWRVLAGSCSLALVLYHLVPYALDTHRLRGYPGPFLAKFSDFWLALLSRGGHRSEKVHELHEKYGPFVRIAPNHLSIAHPDALQTVYAHGNGALKSDFYDAFVAIHRGLFNTRDRAEHTRKRKIVSHIFSQKSVNEFEPHVRMYVEQLMGRWDAMHDLALKGGSGDEGDGGWTGHDGRLWLDLLPWSNYLAFDIIGDLAFGAPFGMILSGADAAQIPKRPEEALGKYGGDHSEIETIAVPAVRTINGRGEYSMTMGCIPPRWRPAVKRVLPEFRRGAADVQALSGIAIMAVAKRLATPTDRNDLLSKLQAAKDEKGQPLGAAELTAEALTLLIAGSDTTSNSTCAIIYYLARHPATQARLQQELDEALGADAAEKVTFYEQVKKLPYLDAVINEALRLHSTSALGLPRIVPAGGMTVMGQFFPEGTVLSVPSYTLHRDEDVWGEDAEDFRPERWFERDQALMQRTFNPFSIGPRACVGKNLATLELQIIISSLLRRYHFVLENPDMELPTREGFLRKPLTCKVGIKRRDDVLL
ncbi:cytochrome P450 [Schizophyllum commune H4-8]|uniref:Cytochrome P450 monooxygenase pc-bph n=1 Tax=Schizophyllum commune (strain H4-8 / FGSC 9210) TaxID=578458 RepID=D8QH55_SCHCM|nr:cytochrome P450 [Schizophyllum commune H4-8]KAI5887036.1 cytochrome P450 [Schizophyllum commune H4-8]